MKEITKEGLEALVKNKYIFNSPRGYVDKRGYEVGFYRTKNKRYIEEKFADLSKELTSV